MYICMHIDECVCVCVCVYLCVCVCSKGKFCLDRVLLTCLRMEMIILIPVTLVVEGKVDSMGVIHCKLYSSAQRSSPENKDLVPN